MGSPGIPLSESSPRAPHGFYDRPTLVLFSLMQRKSRSFALHKGAPRDSRVQFVLREGPGSRSRSPPGPGGRPLGGAGRP